MENYYEKLTNEIENIETAIANLSDKVNDEIDFAKYYIEIMALYDQVFELSRTINSMRIEGKI